VFFAGSISGAFNVLAGSVALGTDLALAGCGCARITCCDVAGCFCGFSAGGGVVATFAGNSTGLLRGGVGDAEVTPFSGGEAVATGVGNVACAGRFRVFCSPIGVFGTPSEENFAGGVFGLWTATSC